MRGPFQEPLPTNHFRVPGNRRTLFGSAAAIGAAFIKSLIPARTPNSFRVVRPSGYRLGKYAAQTLLSATPRQKAQQISSKKVSIHKARFARRTRKQQYKKVQVHRHFQQRSSGRRRYKPYSRNLQSSYKYRPKRRYHRFQRQYHISKRYSSSRRRF